MQNDGKARLNRPIMKKKKNPEDGIAAKTIIDLRMIVFHRKRMRENNGNSLLYWRLCSIASEITEIARM